MVEFEILMRGHRRGRGREHPGFLSGKYKLWKEENILNISIILKLHFKNLKNTFLNDFIVFFF